MPTKRPTNPSGRRSANTRRQPAADPARSLLPQPCGGTRGAVVRDEHGVRAVPGSPRCADRLDQRRDAGGVVIGARTTSHGVKVRAHDDRRRSRVSGEVSDHVTPARRPQVSHGHAAVAAPAGLAAPRCHRTTNGSRSTSQPAFVSRAACCSVCSITGVRAGGCGASLSGRSTGLLLDPVQGDCRLASRSRTY